MPFVLEIQVRRTVIMPTSSSAERFEMPGCLVPHRHPSTCPSIIFLGHWYWSITPLMICYGHFPLWAAINLPHCPFKRSQWRKFSAKHRYRQWSLHFNPTWGFIIPNVARVVLWVPEGNQTSSTFSAFFWGGGGGFIKPLIQAAWSLAAHTST